MTKSVNEKLLDGSIGHDVDLQQTATWLAHRFVGLLNRVDDDLVNTLRDLLDRNPTATPLSLLRIDELLSSVRELNSRAYRTAGSDLEAQLQELAALEAQAQADLLRGALPPDLPPQFVVNSVTALQVRQAALSRPFQGRLLSEWVSQLEENRAKALRDIVRIAYSEGMAPEELIRRIRGTKANQFKDGILNTDRRAAEAVARTAMAHTAATARDAFFAENEDLIEELVWSSTLDLRTSDYCRSRDGKRYTPLTHKPIGHGFAWLGGPGRIHWRCRSSSYPVVKSWRQLGIPIDELPPGTRASMDGQVPADLTYRQWLMNQPAARQDEVLGPTRGKLVRSGELDWDDLYTNRGEMLSVEQLRAKLRK